MVKDYTIMDQYITSGYFRTRDYNRILENIPSNNRSLEIHMMQRFTQECALYTGCQCLPAEFESDFSASFRGVGKCFRMWVL